MRSIYKSFIKNIRILGALINNSFMASILYIEYYTKKQAFIYILRIFQSKY